MRVRKATAHRCVVCGRMTAPKGFQVEWNDFGWTCVLRWACLKAGYRESTPR